MSTPSICPASEFVSVNARLLTDGLATATSAKLPKSSSTAVHRKTFFMTEPGAGNLNTHNFPHQA